MSDIFFFRIGLVTGDVALSVEVHVEGEFVDLAHPYAARLSIMSEEPWEGDGKGFKTDNGINGYD